MRARRARVPAGLQGPAHVPAPGPFVLSHKELRLREPHAGAGRGRQPVWGVAAGPRAEHQSVCPDVAEVPTGTRFPQRL